MQKQRFFYQTIHIDRANVLDIQSAELFSLRYQVYCEECGFLKKEDYPAKVEYDEFDTQSVHAGAFENSTLVGSVRLIPSKKQRVCGSNVMDVSKNQVENPYYLPFEMFCPVFESFEFPDLSQCAEVSRLVVKKQYRTRSTDANGLKELLCISNEAYQEYKERRIESNQLLLGLYRQLYIEAKKRGYRYWFAAMERSLAKILNSSGFGFKRIGPDADYYGKVAPYMADLDQVAKELQVNRPALYEWMHEPLKNKQSNQDMEVCEVFIPKKALATRMISI